MMVVITVMPRATMLVHQPHLPFTELSRKSFNFQDRWFSLVIDVGYRSVIMYIPVFTTATYCDFIHK